MSEQSGEGWYHSRGRIRWHYFRNWYSLCGKFRIWFSDELVAEIDETECICCKTCQRSLAKGLKVKK